MAAEEDSRPGSQSSSQPVRSASQGSRFPVPPGAFLMASNESPLAGTLPHAEAGDAAAGPGSEADLEASNTEIEESAARVDEQDVAARKPPAIQVQEQGQPIYISDDEDSIDDSELLQNLDFQDPMHNNFIGHHQGLDPPNSTSYIQVRHFLSPTQLVLLGHRNFSLFLAAPTA